jgi:hypothetical protein
MEAVQGEERRELMASRTDESVSFMSDEVDRL